MQKKSAIALNRLSSEAYELAPKLPFRVVLDNVRSRHNIGAVFRTADAYRVDEIELCGICCCPPNDEIHKTALGAEQTVHWRYWNNTLDAVAALRQEGYKVYAVEQAFGSITLDNFTESCRKSIESQSKVNPSLPETSSNRIAVVFGHEVFGVSQEVIDACDGCIELEQYGTKHSLNVSVTAGIVIYNIAKIYERV